jgi:hypothetical protein
MNRKKFLKVSTLGLIYLISNSKNIFSHENSLEERICNLYFEVDEKFNLSSNQLLVVNGLEQKIYLVGEKIIKKKYDISTSKYGFGNLGRSYKTPLGIHKIHAKYGEDAPIGTIFENREEVGICKINPTGRGRVSITSRLMSLEGCEIENKNTLSRPIYIHGVSNEGLIGKPASHGCIRMRNKDIIKLFDLVEIGTYVYIKEKI